MNADVEHITCQELVEVLTDYLDGALDPAERADIERHVVFCRGCATYVEQMHSTIDALGLLADEQPGPGADAALLSIFRGWKAGRASGGEPGP